jgi:hypothetical protein
MGSSIPCLLALMVDEVLLEMGGNGQASRVENPASSLRHEGDAVRDCFHIAGSVRGGIHLGLVLGCEQMVIVVMTINFRCVVSCWAGRVDCPENAVGGDSTIWAI